MPAPKYRPYGKVKERFSKALGAVALREPFWKDVRTLAGVIRATRHKEGEIRRTAIWLLGQLYYNRADKALIWALHKDPDIDNRGSAADWFGYLQTERAVTALLDALQNDAHVEIRERAAIGLRWTRKHKRVIDILISVMANKEEDPYVREMVAEAIRHHGAQKAGPVLMEALRDESINVRYWAADALTGSQYAPAIIELERLMREDTAICFEPGTKSDRNPHGLVNGSVCARAANAILSIKEDLGLPLTEEEKEYDQRLQKQAEQRLPFREDTEGSSWSTICIAVPRDETAD